MGRKKSKMMKSILFGDIGSPAYELIDLWCKQNRNISAVCRRAILDYNERMTSSRYKAYMLKKRIGYYRSKAQQCARKVNYLEMELMLRFDLTKQELNIFLEDPSIDNIDDIKQRINRIMKEKEKEHKIEISVIKPVPDKSIVQEVDDILREHTSSKVINNGTN